MDIRVEGTCEPAFHHVREVFSENFRSRGEIGAAVCVYRKGDKVVDIWGGIADPETATPWQEDTIACMMSVGKSMAALAVLMLVDRGQIDLETPVASYWPEFAQNGKGRITVRTLLSGLAALIYADAAPEGSAYDWNVICSALAAQKPEWEPGTKGAYHSFTFGYLLGELVRRVDGRMINAFFREEIARPLQVDYGFGVAPVDLPRVARIMPNSGSVTLAQSQDVGTKLGRAWRPWSHGPSSFNEPDFHAAVMPSSNGHGNARAVARVYALLERGGALDGVRLVSRDLVEEIRKESWRGICGMTDRPFRYGLGFFLNCPPHLPFGANPRAFGHPGAGGAVGIADPEAGLAMSYSPNLMCAGAGVGDRCEALVEAVLGRYLRIDP